MYLKHQQLLHDDGGDMVVTTDLGPRGPCVWPTLMCRPAPGLKLSLLWASEVTADSTSSVWTSILCGLIIGVANLCVLTTFNLLLWVPLWKN